MRRAFTTTGSGRPLVGSGRRAARRAARLDRARAARRVRDDARQVPPAGHAEPGCRRRSRPAATSSSGRSSSCARASSPPSAISRRARSRAARTASRRRTGRCAAAVARGPRDHAAPALPPGRGTAQRAAPARARGRCPATRRAARPRVPSRARPQPAARRRAAVTDAPMSSSSASSEQETAALAAALARDLPHGAVVYVEGELGAGKTAFVRGAAQRARRAGAGHEPDVHGGASLRRRSRGRSRTSTCLAASALDEAAWGDLEPYFDDVRAVFVEWAGVGRRRAAAAARRRAHRRARRRARGR